MADTGGAVARLGGSSAMRENNRVRPQRFELSLDGRQATAVLVGTLVILGAVFVLGLSLGRQAAARAAAQPVAVHDALAPLDQPLAGSDEPPPVLKAPQALTDDRSIEKTMPVPQVKVAARTPPAPAARSTSTSTSTSTPTTSPSPSPTSTGSPDQRSDPSALSPSTSASASPSPTLRTGSAPPEAARSRRAGAAFTIQVASSQKREDAERLAKQLAARNPRVVSADVPGKGRWYRVQIGAFESQEAAKRQLAALSRAGVRGIVTATR
jgi:DedD protein